jgi:acetoin utilization protein AcuB
MLMPPISRYMTRQPWTIERSETLTAAHQLMRSHAIRHLPVMDRGKLIGIVSERDLHLIETLPDADPDEVQVDEAMTEDVYVAAPLDEVAEVVERMSDQKIGSVIVMNDARVEGIFTSIDALQVLAAVLRRTIDLDR